MKTLFRISFLPISLFAFCAFYWMPTAMEGQDKQTIFEHLQQEPFLTVRLETDFKQYIKGKTEEIYQPAKLNIQKADGSIEVWDIEIRPRGNMRRLVCDIPPMKMRFSEEQLKERGLAKRSTLKMVIICQNGSDYEQMLLREYLAYKLYNQISNHSFKVQLAKVKYQHTGDGNSGIEESFAFFIEHPQNLVERTDTRMLEGGRFGSASLNSDVGEQFALFQFMIGNTDWYFYNGHNVEICGIEGAPDLIPLPYDFDYAGFVKTPYAMPHEKLNITSVTERYYQGYCRTEEETKKNIQLFLDKKATLLQEVENLLYLDKRSKKYASWYLKGFYKIIEKPKKVKRHILNHCDRWPVR